MNRDLTRGKVLTTMLLFAVPMIIGNLLQQCYNIVDTLIVGRFVGSTALAAVGSSFTLMTFLTSILLGLCMGSGTYFSICYGKNDMDAVREGAFTSFLLIAFVTVLLTILSLLALDTIEVWMNVPTDVWPFMKDYLRIVFYGIPAIFVYNYYASLLRSVGNSVVPLVFLAVSTCCNIILDLWLIIGLSLGTSGAALATIIAQYISALGIAVFTIHQYPKITVWNRTLKLRWSCIRTIGEYSFLTCFQQSIMNLGILMVQGLVNSFGTVVMAAFSAAVKIDAFAYMPVQDFGNAFSTFIAQNYGANQYDRIKEGTRKAVLTVCIFCFLVSVIIYSFASPLLQLFIDSSEIAIIAEGVRYLHIEGAFYVGIGCLFLWYGLYRAMGRPGISVVLTIVSLGTRVLLAYALSAIPSIGVVGIWWSVPIGWALADITGFIIYRYSFMNKLHVFENKF